MDRLAILLSNPQTLERGNTYILLVATAVMVLFFSCNILKGSFLANVGMMAFLHGQMSGNELQLKQSANWFRWAVLYRPLTVITQMGLILTRERLGEQSLAVMAQRMDPQAKQQVLERLWALADRDTRLGKPLEALRWHQITVELFADSPYALIQLAGIQISLGEIDQAMVLLKRAVSMPNYKLTASRWLMLM